MEKTQTTIRLTLRLPDGLDETVRIEAKKRGMSINQFLISVLNQRQKSLRSASHTP